MFVDSHCHLSFPELHDDVEAICAEMAAAQVDRALTICTTLEEFPRVHALATGHEVLCCTVGVHPDNEGVAEPTLEDLLERAARPRVLAIGETGLDYYRLNGRSVEQMEWQRERFRVHIRAARTSGLPLVVHTRSASADTLEILRAEGEGRVRGVFHCFTETREVARAALEMGFLGKAHAAHRLHRPLAQGRPSQVRLEDDTGGVDDPAEKPLLRLLPRVGRQERVRRGFHQRGGAQPRSGSAHRQKRQVSFRCTRIVHLAKGQARAPLGGRDTTPSDMLSYQRHAHSHDLAARANRAARLSSAQCKPHRRQP